MIESLYRDYHNQLLWYCINLSSNNRAMAEDVVQDTFMRALENAHILNDLTNAQCRSWLYKTAKNIFIDRIRRINNEPKPQLQLITEDDLSDVMVRQLCGLLPEEERELFWLRYMEALDISSLINKRASFITRRAIISEALLEDGVHLFEDDTDIIVIPTGYRYVQGGNLNEMMVNKGGNKLYVDGDLIITTDSENALNKLVGIRVNGSILVTDKLKDRLLNLDTEYDDIKKIKGNIISDKGILKISSRTLMDLDDGLTIIDCGMVTLDMDITPSEIEEMLQFIDCGAISCTSEQRGVIELVSEDVGYISDKGLGGLEKLGEEEDEPSLYQKNTQVINAATYKM